MSAPAPSRVPADLTGSVLVLIQFDVCEEFHLDRLQQTVSARTLPKPTMKQVAPAYVHYQRPPVVEPIEPLILDSGEQLQGEIKYFDYGVVSLMFRHEVAGGWDTLVPLASRWVWDIDFVSRAEPIVGKYLQRVSGAMVKPYQRWLSEDYFIFHIREAAGSPSPSELIRQHGPEIAQLVRGERATLSEGECAEVLNSKMSYYSTDLSVIGWNAAFLYYTPTGAETAIQLLEYANSQLLEFRHYDELLTGVLAGAYDSFGKDSRLFARWRLARSATNLNTVLLEVVELTERADNAIKFLSDMFAARLYRLASARVGVPDYRDLVEQKLRTAEELYHYMLDQFNHSRAFLLEATVVIILLVELFLAFRGRLF
jgi:hypothetical protein